MGRKPIMLQVLVLSIRLREQSFTSTSQCLARRLTAWSGFGRHFSPGRGDTALRCTCAPLHSCMCVSIGIGSIDGFGVNFGTPNKGNAHARRSIWQPRKVYWEYSPKLLSLTYYTVSIHKSFTIFYLNSELIPFMSAAKQGSSTHSADIGPQK